VLSGPGEARTILLLHIISARPSKQPDDDDLLFVLAETTNRLLLYTHLGIPYVTFLPQGVYGVRFLFFVSARTNKRHHHANSCGQGQLKNGMDN
jgi:hypothetical protein